MIVSASHVFIYYIIYYSIRAPDNFFFYLISKVIEENVMRWLGIESFHGNFKSVISLSGGIFLMCFVFVVVENILGQSSVKDKHACHSVPHNYFRASDEAVTHLRVQMGNISSSVQHTPSRSRRRIREDQRTCLSIIFLGRS